MSGKSLRHTLDGTECAPFFEGAEEPAHACIRRFVPKVVFGGTHSGVATQATSDGTTLLEEVWEGALFAGGGVLVERGESTVDSWVLTML